MDREFRRRSVPQFSSRRWRYSKLANMIADEQTRSRLTDRLPAERFVIAPTGLDEDSGNVDYDYYPGEPALTSLIGLPHSLPSTRRSAEVSTGDRYVAEAGIDQVDLLKIDVEGAEGRVLRGFAGTLARRAIRVLQFEYGLANVAACTLLADHYQLLDDHGYTVGRLFPDGVEFRPFDLTMESFRGGNFVAVARTDHAELDALDTPSRWRAR